MSARSEQPRAPSIGTIARLFSTAGRTGRVRSRPPIDTKFSEAVRIAGTSTPAEFRERGSTGADAVVLRAERPVGTLGPRGTEGITVRVRSVPVVRCGCGFQKSLRYIRRHFLPSFMAVRPFVENCIPPPRRDRRPT
jgi:hypothetical protein